MEGEKGRVLKRAVRCGASLTAGTVDPVLKFLEGMKIFVDFLGNTMTL